MQAFDYVRTADKTTIFTEYKIPARSGAAQMSKSAQTRKKFLKLSLTLLIFEGGRLHFDPFDELKYEILLS